MKNAKKSISLVMVAIFTTFVMLSGIPVSAKVTKTAKKVVVTSKATAAKILAAKKLAAKRLAAKKLAAKKLVDAKKLAAKNAGLIAAQKAVDNAEKLTNADNYDLVANATDLANAQDAITTSLDAVTKLNKDSADYKGLMARIDAANGLVIKAMDELDVIAADLATVEGQKTAVIAAEKAVVAVEAAPLVTAADLKAALELGKTAATAVVAVKDTVKVDAFTARLKVVYAKALAAQAILDAALVPAKVLTVSAVDGTITVTMDKALLVGQTFTPADFTVTKTVTTLSAVSAKVVPTAVTTNGAVVVLTVPVTVAATTDQSVVYSAAYTTGSAVNAVAYNVAALPIFAVSSVTVLNANQINVSFNKLIDKTIAETMTNYTVKENGVSILDAKATAKLQADGMSVIVTFKNMVNSNAVAYNQKTLAVTAKNIKSTTNDIIADYSNAAVALFDATVPSVVGVTQVGPKVFDITFSEPVNQSSLAVIASAIKINNGAYNLSAATIDSIAAVGTNVVRITTSATLVNGAYTITINNSTLVPAGNLIKDYAGFAVPAYSATLNVIADTSAISASVVKVAYNKVTVQFSKSVSNATDANVKYRLTYNNTSYQVSGTAAVANANYDNAYDVTFATAIPVGANTLYVHYSATSATDSVIQDGYLNTFANDTALAFTVANDTTVPTATLAFNAATGNFEVTYSKSVQGADSTGSYVLTNSVGTVVALTTATLKTGTTSTYVLTPVSTVQGSTTVAIVASKVKDFAPAQNYVVAVTLGAIADDITSPTVASVSIDNATHRIYVYYSEAMITTGVNSVLDKSNYLYKGLSLPSGTIITLGTDSKSVIITVPVTTTLATSDTITVARVADLVGNVTDGFQTVFAGSLGSENSVAVLVGNASSSTTALPVTTMPNAMSVKITSTKTAEFYLNRQISGADASQIILDGKVATSISYVNTTVTASDASTTLSVAKVTATFASKSFNASVATEFATAGGTHDLVFGANAFVTLNGTQTLGIASAVVKTAVCDYVAPAIATDLNGVQLVQLFDRGATAANVVAVNAAVANGEADTLIIKLNDNVNSTQFNASMISVPGFVVTSAVLKDSATFGSTPTDINTWINTHAIGATAPGDIIIATIVPAVGTAAGTTAVTATVTLAPLTDIVVTDVPNGILANTSAILTTDLVDKMLPVISSVTLNSATSITVKLSEAVTYDNTKAITVTGFSADGTANAVVAVTGTLAANGKSITLVPTTVGQIFQTGAVVGNVINIPAATFTDGAATANASLVLAAKMDGTDTGYTFTVTDNAAPVVVVGVGTKTISGTTAQLTFSENVIIPTSAVGRFAINAANTADITTPPSGTATAVITLTFANATMVTGLATIVDYTPLAAGNVANLKDAAGNEVGSFTDKAVASSF